MNEKSISLTLEEVRVAYFDKDALIEPSYKLFRYDKGGQRFYYYFDNGRPKFFIGVTSLIGASMPTDEFLIKWIANMGYDKAQAYSTERAHYGTFLHIQCAELLIARSYDLEKLDEHLEKYLTLHKVGIEKIKEWGDELRKDVLAFAQFCIDVNLKPYAIEIPLASVANGFAGTLDILGQMEIEVKGNYGEYYKTGANAGKAKETKKKIPVIAVVDIKSGRKGFGDQAVLQLGCYRIMVKENFPQFKDKDIRLFNWSPKDWRSIPGYNLVEQTDSEVLEKLPFVLGIGQSGTPVAKRLILETGGIIDLDKGSVDKNFISQDIETYIGNLHEKFITQKPKQEAADDNIEETEEIIEPKVKTEDMPSQEVVIIEEKKEDIMEVFNLPKENGDIDKNKKKQIKPNLKFDDLPFD